MDTVRRSRPQHRPVQSRVPDRADPLEQLWRLPVRPPRAFRRVVTPESSRPVRSRDAVAKTTVREPQPALAGAD
jgi:hypothetical protein